MEQLHPQMRESLQQLPEQRAVHLLTRHSIREPATSGFADYRLPLTAEGVRLAEQWGAALQRPVHGFCSSPVPRCLDTASAMCRGAAAEGLVAPDCPVEQVPVLVEPGCYVEDVNQAGPAFFRLGALDFINQHLTQGVAGVLSPAAGRDRLLSHFCDYSPAPGTVQVHVTHDTILAAFVAGLHDHDRITDEDWPWMMEGLWLWFDESHLNWIWRGRAERRPLLP
jgi:hypothetical protein